MSADPIACARWLARGEASWLHDEVGQRMEARLQWMRQSPHTWLDWMPLNGGLATHQRVRERYPHAKVYVHEASAQRHAQAWSQLRGPWWSHVWQRCLGRDTLQRGEPPAGQMQMLWANMVLHLMADPQAMLKQWQQMLAPDGFVMFSCLGPDTLRELAEVYRAQGWPAPSHDHTDMHDWGDMLVQSGFAEPVMDMERLTLTYASPEHLARLHQALMALARPSHDGRLVLTIEVIYGHALKAAPRAPVSETSTVSLQDMRAMLKSEST